MDSLKITAPANWETLDPWHYENLMAERIECGADRIIAGVDEAGRGPLAGPVYAAAVILPRDFNLQGISDSKKLNEKQRNEAYERIISEAVAYGIACVEAEVIDKINILQAARLAMLKALENMGLIPQAVLIDGRDRIDCPLPQQPIIGGDAKCISISAASILAKVERDRRMAELDCVYPGYGFAKHKGYGTAEHLKAIDLLGICPEHRKSFGPIAKLVDKQCRLRELI